MTYKAVTQRVMPTAIKNCLVDMLILFRLFIAPQGSVSPTVFTLYQGTEPVDSFLTIPLTSPAKAPFHGKVWIPVIIAPVLESYLTVPNLSQQLSQNSPYCSWND